MAHRRLRAAVIASKTIETDAMGEDLNNGSQGRRKGFRTTNSNEGEKRSIKQLFKNIRLRRKATTNTQPETPDVIKSKLNNGDIKKKSKFQQFLEFFKRKRKFNKVAPVVVTRKESVISICSSNHSLKIHEAESEAALITTVSQEPIGKKTLPPLKSGHKKGEYFEVDFNEVPKRCSSPRPVSRMSLRGKETLTKEELSRKLRKAIENKQRLREDRQRPKTARKQRVKQNKINLDALEAERQIQLKKHLKKITEKAIGAKKHKVAKTEQKQEQLKEHCEIIQIVKSSKEHDLQLKLRKEHVQNMMKGSNANLRKELLLAERVEKLKGKNELVEARMRTYSPIPGAVASPQSEDFMVKIAETKLIKDRQEMRSRSGFRDGEDVFVPLLPNWVLKSVTDTDDMVDSACDISFNGDFLSLDDDDAGGNPKSKLPLA